MAETSDQLAAQRTTLAVTRTRFAADRTLMAWMRTAVSFIGLGFTIYKFFEYLERSGMAKRDWHPSAPRRLAIALITLGLICLLAAIIEYLAFIKRIAGRWPLNLSLGISVLLWVLGILALIAVIWRAGPI